MPYLYDTSPGGDKLAITGCDLHPGGIILTAQSCDGKATVPVCIAAQDVEAVTAQMKAWARGATANRG